MFRWLFSKPKKKRIKKIHQESHYNLQQIYDTINARYFENKLDLPIRWFGDREFKPKYRIRLGVYHQRKQAIKIHRTLDSPSIPPYFVAFIVYHEMLHHVLPPIKKWGQRRKIHHPAFKERERQFQEYALVRGYQKQLKDHLFNVD